MQDLHIVEIQFVVENSSIIKGTRTVLSYYTESNFGEMNFSEIISVTVYSRHESFRITSSGSQIAVVPKYG